MSAPEPNERSISTEAPTPAPLFLIGGSHHGEAYLGLDQPRELRVASIEPIMYFHPHETPHSFTPTVERYLHREARVGPWATPWIYYAHDSMDAEMSMLALWSFVWEAASRLARSGGWDPEHTCEFCKGTGLARSPR